MWIDHLPTSPGWARPNRALKYPTTITCEPELKDFSSVPRSAKNSFCDGPPRLKCGAYTPTMSSFFWGIFENRKC